jgi:hypothetical protein
LVLTAKEKKTHPHLNVRHCWVIYCFDELVLAQVDYRQRFLKIQVFHDRNQGSDISGFEVKWGCSSRSDDPVDSVQNGNSSLNVIKGLEISDFKNKQG